MIPNERFATGTGIPLLARFYNWRYKHNFKIQKGWAQVPVVSFISFLVSLRILKDFKRGDYSL